MSDAIHEASVARSGSALSTASEQRSVIGPPRSPTSIGKLSSTPSERVIDLLTGHAKQSMLAHYSTGPEFSTLQDAMLKIDYGSELTKLARAHDWCVTERPKARVKQSS